MGIDVGTLSGRIELQDFVSGAIDLVNHKIDQLDEKFGGLGHHIVASAASFFTAEAAIEAVKEAAHLAVETFDELVIGGSKVAGVEQNFENLTIGAGRLSKTLLGALRDGTRGTITDFELMKATNRDLAAGMTLTDAQFSTLAKGAFALAKATGVDVKDALETLNSAMLTGRTRAVAMLTGKIDLAEAERKYADSLGITVEHLTAEEKIEAARIAILEKVAGATTRIGDQAVTLGGKIAQAQTEWSNFEEDLGKTLATSPTLTKAFDDIKGAIAGAFGIDKEQAIANITAKIEGFASTASGVAQTAIAGFGVAKDFVVEYGGAIETLAGVIGAYYAATTLAMAGTAAFKVTMSGVSTLMTEVTAATFATQTGLIGAAAALGAFVGFKLGQLQPISDFFQNLGLAVMGYSSEERAAMIQTSHDVDKAAADLDPLKQAHDQAAAAAAHQKEETEKLIAANKAEIEAAKATAAAEAEANEITRLSTEEKKKYTEGWEKLNAMGHTWQETLADVNESTKGTLSYYIKMGASVEDLAATFPKLTKAQVEAAVAGEKAAKDLLKAQLDGSIQLTKLHGDNINDWIKDEQKKFDITQGGLLATGKITQQVYDQEKANFQAMIDGEIHSRDAQNEYSKDFYQKQVDEAKNALDLMLRNSDAHSDQEIREARRNLEEKKRMLDHWRQYADDAYEKHTGTVGSETKKQVDDILNVAEAWAKVGTGISADTVKVKALSGEVMTLAAYQKQQLAGNSMTYDLSTKAGIDYYRKMNPSASIQWSDSQIMDFVKKGGTLQQLIQMHIINPYAGFAEGGYGDFGSGTLAMLHGKEIITPIDKVGAMGGTVINHIYVNGTAADVARKVSEEIMRTLKRQRQFGAA
jgi:hypothetical protein